MYCPRCASQNTDGAKFCRTCGTDLEMVSRVLADDFTPANDSRNEEGKPVVVENSLAKRAKGVRNAIQGGVLLGASLLIGLALALFSGIKDWIIIWTIFFSWLAGWGIVSLAFGLGSVMELRTLLRRSELAAAPGKEVATTKPLASAGNRGTLGAGENSSEGMPPASVTEQTTEPLLRVPLTSRDT